MNLEGPIIQQIKNYSALEVDNNKVKDVERVVDTKEKGKQKDIGFKIKELAKIIQIHDFMSPFDIELEKRCKEKDSMDKKL